MSEMSSFDHSSFDRYSYNFLESYNKNQQERLSDYAILDDSYLNVASPPPFQTCDEEVKRIDSNLNEGDLKRRKQFDEMYPSIGILKNFKNGVTQSKGEKIKLSISYAEHEIPKKGAHKLSLGDILRLAGEIFIQSSSKNFEKLSMLSHCPCGVLLLGYSEDEKQDVELVQNLLASAEKIAQQNYKSAYAILSLCMNSSSRNGNPVQRLVHYFSEALCEKIDRETGKVPKKNIGKEEQFDIDEAMMRPNPTIIAHHKQMPYGQISAYTTMQAIIENVAKAKKIHVIDLQIRSGLQYTVLMQSLAGRNEYPVELLKITAIGTKSKETIEKTGEWLTSFAKSMNLPFYFDMVMVSDMLDLKREDFNIYEDETVAIYSSYLLRTIIPKQDRLESLMTLLKEINPSILALTEVEANHSSPVFVKRFTESLFFFGAYFDCLGDCMDPEDPHRQITESMYFGEGIRNIIAFESDERTTRHVNISVWRSFFARFGMIEEELSTASMYQASLLVKNMPNWSSCSFAMDGKCLTVGWKGTPLVSVSAWKFSQRK